MKNTIIMNLKKIVLALVLITVASPSLGAMKRPNSTQDSPTAKRQRVAPGNREESFTISLSAGQKISDISYNVLAASPVLKNIVDSNYCNEIKILGVEKQTMDQLLEYMDIIAARLSRNIAQQAIIGEISTFLLINQLATHDINKLYQVATSLECTIMQKALDSFKNRTELPGCALAHHSKNVPQLPTNNVLHNPQIPSQNKAQSHNLGTTNFPCPILNEISNEYSNFELFDVCTTLNDFPDNPFAQPKPVLLDHNKAPFPTTDVHLHERTYANQKILGGEKPFKCPYIGCGYEAKRKDYLDKHLRTHTGETPYKCTYDKCDKSFSQLSTLTRHMVTHTDQKPHQCPHCDFAATQKCNLNQHIKSMHKNV